MATSEGVQRSRELLREAFWMGPDWYRQKDKIYTKAEWKKRKRKRKLARKQRRRNRRKS